jgi:hypothetical protein
MRALCFLFLPVLCLSALAAEKATTEFTLVDAQECRPRNGLPHVLEKAKSTGAIVSGLGHPIKVAYLGGSITAQAGWRTKTFAFLKKQFPEANFQMINASVGGTGSDVGVFRLQQDVLAYEPDLLFVEFAVNDGELPPQQIIRYMEGIVRQTRKAFPTCDICFIYTIGRGHTADLVQGKFPISASAMEKVADFYGIPSIHLGLEVARLDKEGRILWRAPLPKTDEEKAALGDKIAYSPDNVHPHPETGHNLFMDAFKRAWPEIVKASTNKEPYTLNKPLDEKNYEAARIAPISKAKFSPGLKCENLAEDKDEELRDYARRMPTVVKLTKPGQFISFRFKGTHVAIYDIIAPYTGKVAVTLDKGPPKIFTRFDSYSDKPRVNYFTIAADLPDAVHEVKIELIAEKVDKAKILSERKITIDKPQVYAPHYFYPGSLLVKGEILP